MRICFDVDRFNFLLLQEKAKNAGMSIPGVVRDLITTHLGTAKHNTKGAGHERRVYDRKQVLIPAVSCVKVPDSGMHSCPVVIEDISKSGVRISFKSTTEDIVEQLSRATFFEVVFTIPNSRHTVSIYCKRVRTIVDGTVSMAGMFDCNSQASMDLLSGLVA